jgi:hypothetical protein
LKRQGCTNAQIREAVSKFDDSPSNEINEIYPGLKVSKWDIEKVEVNLNSTSLMNPFVPLKIAFEFIACHLGAPICSPEPQLQKIRNMLLGETTDNECFQIEWLNSDEDKPFHGLALESNEKHAQVQIRLFGRLAFRVHFKKLKVHAPRCVYTHFLDTNAEDLRLIENNGRMA